MTIESSGQVLRCLSQRASVLIRVSHNERARREGHVQTCAGVSLARRHRGQWSIVSNCQRFRLRLTPHHPVVCLVMNLRLEGCNVVMAVPMASQWTLSGETVPSFPLDFQYWMAGGLVQ